MNTQHLQQIINHYIDLFEELNGPVHMEYYKWQIAHDFRPMMDDALSAPDEEFADKLYQVKKRTWNLIDSYTQPLNGLVAFAKIEPGTVREMFKDLLQTAEADVKAKQAAIQAFLGKSHQLREKYYPDSYLYKDDLHSVTGYLFLYDPDHNYLYKATHCRDFADCVEFYDDWGSGETTKLNVFFKMCDEVLAAIRNNEALMATAASRYDHDPEGMHPDTEKHILLFDLIYCCSTYGLFKGIDFSVPKSAERKLIQERKEKARELSAALEKAQKELEQLNEGKAFLSETFKPGVIIQHKSYGEGEIVQVGDKNMTVSFPKAGQKTLGIIMCVVNELCTVEDEQVQAKLKGYRDILRRHVQIRDAVSRSERALIPYTDYLD